MIVYAFIVFLVCLCAYVFLLSVFVLFAFGFMCVVAFFAPVWCWMIVRFASGFLCEVVVFGFARVCVWCHVFVCLVYDLQCGVVWCACFGLSLCV